MGFMRVIFSVSFDDQKIVPARGSKFMGRAKQSHGLYNPEQLSFLPSVAKEAENKRLLMFILA